MMNKEKAAQTHGRDRKCGIAAERNDIQNEFKIRNWVLFGLLMAVIVAVIKNLYTGVSFEVLSWYLGTPFADLKTGKFTDQTLSLIYWIALFIFLLIIGIYDIFRNTSTRWFVSTVFKCVAFVALAMTIQSATLEAITSELALIQENVIESKTTAELDSNPLCAKVDGGKYNCMYIRTEIGYDSSLIGDKSAGQKVSSVAYRGQDKWRVLRLRNSLYKVVKTPSDAVKQIETLTAPKGLTQ